jgi:hypothetical protein
MCVLPVTAACSGPPNPPTVTGASFPQPTDSASPARTLTAPADAAGFPTDTVGAAPPPAAAPTLDLPGCMIGSWSAPLPREFGAMGIGKRSDGLITGGSGTVLLTLGQDRTFSYTYRQVTLTLAAGQLAVDGPVTGTWALAGDMLTTAVSGAAVTTKATVAGVSVPNRLEGLVRSFAPTDVHVLCTGSGLQMLLPGAQGGGTVTFDRS